MRFRLLLAAINTCFLAYTTLGYADVSISGPYAVAAKLMPSSPTDSLFGYSVALDKGTAVVGGAQGMLADPATVALIFSGGSGTPWSLQTTLSVPYAELDSADDYNACLGVAVSGTTVVAGEPAAGVGPYVSHGEVDEYVLGSGWSLDDIIFNLDVPDSRYGCGLALDAGTMLVGSVSYSLSGSGGRAYVMTRTEAGWERQAMLTDNVKTTGMFSQVLALSGDVAVVGDPIEIQSVGNATGAAYVFRRTGKLWSPGMKLMLPDGVNRAAFGAALATDGDTIVVGAPGNTVDSVAHAGSAYIYTYARGAWTLQTELLSPVHTRAGAFGSAVGVDGDTVVIGEMKASAAHVYKRLGSGWTLVATINGSTSADQFGSAIAMSKSSHTFIVGAPNEHSGRAYVFVDDEIFADHLE